MDKRELARLFRERLARLLAERESGITRFAEESGVDRSALSQFLDPDHDRLPRAETLRRIAETGGVTVDWLLALSNVTEGRQEVTPSAEIETAIQADGASPLKRWREESVGRKLRYVPAVLPDALCIPEVMSFEFDPARAAARSEHGDSMVDFVRRGDMDLEIAMPYQRLQALAEGQGVWRQLSDDIRRRQLAAMAEVVRETYPALRLHLYDSGRNYSAPFTVFGTIRAAIYLGGAYLVVTASDQVRRLANLFDGLVRESAVPQDRLVGYLDELAAGIG